MVPEYQLRMGRLLQKDHQKLMIEVSELIKSIELIKAVTITQQKTGARIVPGK